MDDGSMAPKDFRDLHCTRCPCKANMISLPLLSGLSLLLLLCQTSGLSILANTRWKLQLDIGLEPGTWMPKRFPGWAESGARLGLDVDIEFSDTRSSERESLVGPLKDTFQVSVCSSDSTFVSDRGQESVSFTGGGWCIQRPKGDINNSVGGLVKPEGLLRFWLDCESGAKRRDVEIRPSTRVFFSTGLWDDTSPEELPKLQTEYKQTIDKMNELLDRTRQTRQENDWLKELRSYPAMVDDSKEFDRLKVRKETLEKAMPPPNTAIAENGVQLAPKGSLVIKGNSIPDWLPGSEYLILGTFSTKPLGGGGG